MRNHMKIIVRGGRILNPSDKTDIIGDLYIEDGVIKEIGETLKTKETTDKVINAKGCYCT